ncbi:MAG TPA: outer membrane lipid asymmetry maintenance protein MlaD [Verrucomicrobiae bacterium]|nr:outer membrane lipid asymmetry maintenance protein MlaD [Verrucomicrobiae bacterium]
MQTKALELLVGLFFTLGVAAVFILTFRVASVTGGGEGGYEVSADFENIGGLKPGAAVTLAGVRIGRVRTIVINPDSFEAKVTMRIENGYNFLPKDTAANIFTAGLLGEQYIGLSPGGEETNLADGDTIKFTQSALVLENLIGQFVAGMGSGGAKDKDKE